MHLRRQRTIARPVEIRGFGYWSGKDVNVRFCPAPEQHGVVFVREDLASPVRIPAKFENRLEMPRRTTLAAEGAAVEMVEHILAAMAGMRIDNCEVWVDQAEMPGGDGSAELFAAALEEAGVQVQHAPRPLLMVAEQLCVGDESACIEAHPAESGFSIHYRLDYGSHNPIGKQSVELEVTPASFRRELSRARTFLFQQEAEWLRRQGLGRRVTSQDLLVFDELGPIENELRFENECARHKTLDVVGDLALCGCDLVGRIVAFKSGHQLNARLVEALLAEGRVIEEMRKSA